MASRESNEIMCNTTKTYKKINATCIDRYGDRIIRFSDILC